MKSKCKYVLAFWFESGKVVEEVMMADEKKALVPSNPQQYAFPEWSEMTPIQRLEAMREHLEAEATRERGGSDMRAGLPGKWEALAKCLEGRDDS